MHPVNAVLPGTSQSNATEGRTNVNETLTGVGFTLEQVCRDHGLSFKNIARNSKVKGQTVLEYLADQTGKQWVQRGKRYHQL